ncbi:MAG: hypothetical protein HON68_01100 [Gammaproteobacteria bacterium]|jgi:TolB-like protein|nr:hypothetical protein [Gammaproteobacteria bacterium]MBT3490615.1 hypothetical protein [Gammaproteobacteria bacterium]MBT3718033.1 hypothetical protein [Gammaproteobacteria bacterium]MBT3844882.1 hypothetical protein [Gammaproteobacteria bacterium]MBT3891977.1 hypothetical protein [Gammaproteobacteria bacterium]
MKKKLIALLPPLLFCGSASALFLTSEGNAPIRHNDTSTARYLATLDAMNQASLENGAQVTSDTIMNNLEVRSDTVRIRTQGKVGQVHMLQEWQDNGIYYVRISAEVSDNPLNCGSPTALVHNKRIGVTQFINQASSESSDLRDVEQGLARMLIQQLNQTPALHAINLSEYAINSDDFNDRQEQVRQLAKQSGAQFILSGTLAQSTRESIGDLAESGLMKGFSSLIGMVQEKAQNRHLEIQTTLYDGESGEAIDNSSEGISLMGETYVGRNTRVGSHAFLSTETGAGFHKLISAQVRDLAEHLSCQPMTTTIRSIQGNVITLPVGRNAGIHSGDRLIIVEQGNPLNILGTLQMTQVSGTQSAGMTDIDAKTLGINITDLVRSW